MRSINRVLDDARAVVLILQDPLLPTVCPKHPPIFENFVLFTLFLEFEKFFKFETFFEIALFLEFDTFFKFETYLNLRH